MWKNRVPAQFKGVDTHFASVGDLIAMKEAAGREDKDLPDVKRLRQLRRSLEQLL